MEPLWWHKCERWWNGKFSCPYSGNIPEPEDDPIPRLVPPAKAQENAKWDSLDDLDFKDTLVPVIKPPFGVHPPVPVPGPAHVPVPNAPPVPIPFPRPAAPPYPNPIPQRPAASGTPSQVPLSPKLRFQERLLDDFAMEVSSSARTRSFTGQDLTRPAVSPRLQRELTSLNNQGASATATYLPPYTGGGPSANNTGNSAENMSTALAEVALVAALRRRRTASRAGSSIPTGLEPEPAVPTQPPSEPLRLPAPKPEDLAPSFPPTPAREPVVTPDRLLMLAAATAAGVDLLHKFMGGGGRGPGNQPAGRGFNVEDVITSTEPVPSVGFDSPPIPDALPSMEYTPERSRNRPSRRRRANAQEKRRRKQRRNA